MLFKDDMTGKDGQFDLGENQVDLTVEGAGKSGLALSQFFFEKIKEANYPTYCITANLKDGTMDVKKASVFGQDLEIICRFRQQVALSDDMVIILKMGLN